MQKKTVNCTECQNSFDVDEETNIGDVVECPHCGSELRVMNINGDALEVEIIQEEK